MHCLVHEKLDAPSVKRFSPGAEAYFVRGVHWNDPDISLRISQGNFDIKPGLQYAEVVKYTPHLFRAIKVLQY